MNNFTQFMSNDNINLLWDVLLDELHINRNNNKIMLNIKIVFESNIKPFTAKTNPNTKLMELNKLFLRQVVLAVNKLYSIEQNIKRITITDEEVSEPYKIEDIHASRQTDFEKEVERKRLDLENYMTLKKPKELDFSDNTSDGKITAMDALVSEKMAQRNLEIEQLQNTNYNTTNIDPEKWLSPKETSVKGEKKVYEKNNNNIKLKYITPEGNMIEQKAEKKVTWNDQESRNNIFKKLKKREEEEPIDNSTLDEKIAQKQYAQQNSIPLPEVKSEQIVSTNNINILNNPIIPKNEIVKQMNEMNTKIDNLYDIVSKLTKLVEHKMIHPSIATTDIQETDIQETDIQETD